MSILMRLAAVYLLLVAVAVAVNFIITPWYHPGGDTPYEVWEVLNWFMAVAVAVALVGSYTEKRGVDSDTSADVKNWLGANAVFFSVAAIFIVFFWNWFSDLAPNHEPDGQFWVVIDTLMPLAIGAAGCRMWRTAG